MQGGSHDIWIRVRAYLRILVGDALQADQILAGFLKHRLVAGRPPATLAEALAQIHRWLPGEMRHASHDAVLSEPQRLLRWYLSGFTFRERALIVLSSLPDVGSAKAAGFVGLHDEEAAEILHDAERRVADASVVVFSAQAFVALDVAMIVEDLGIRRVRMAPHLEGLSAMAAAERPIAVVADTAGGLSPECIQSALNVPRRCIPSVILDSRGRCAPGSIGLRKPFTARALHQALLMAIGA